MGNKRAQQWRMSRTLFRWVLAAFFIGAGINHFRVPSVYIAMIPPWLPWPAGLNRIAGVCEVLGGTGVLIPSVRLAAGWGLIALLVAVFPANLHVAIMGHMPGYGFSPVTLWLRLPLQAVLIAWVAWVAIREERTWRPGPAPDPGETSGQG
jgi:uncharacterized membrane protein